jgi:CheY-like chemotaxis protein
VGRAKVPVSSSKATVLPFVLVVEDDLDLRQGLEDILAFADYHVQAVTTPAEALGVLRQAPSPPVLIVSDILMPGMDGYQFLKAVRANPQWKHIPFLFVSGQEATNLVEDPKFGAIGYLCKPFGVPELLYMVGRLRSRAGYE